MKILDLKIEGFRSLKSVEWKPGDINILIGPNAGGKSNLLQALEMITESAQGKLADFIKKQGGMQSIIWNGKAEDVKIKIETSPKLKFAYIENDYIQNLFDKSKSLEYKLEITRFKKAESYQVELESLLLQKGLLNLIERTSLDAVVIDDEGKEQELSPQKQLISGSESLLFLFSSPVAKNRPIGGFQKELSSWSIYLHFDTGPKSLVRQPIITSYETRVKSDGENFCSVIHSLYEENRDFHDEINSGMKAAFPDYEKLSFVSAGGDGRIQLSIWWKSLGKPQSAANLSDGTLRFLYLLTILADPDPPALIAIDEPEAGLHPRMLPIIAEYALEASRRTQVILATHSPEMLSAFGRRQSEVTVTVAEWEEGQTKLSVLEGDKLNYWLKEYTLGEMFRSGQLENMA